MNREDLFQVAVEHIDLGEYAEAEHLASMLYDMEEYDDADYIFEECKLKRLEDKRDYEDNLQVDMAMGN